MQSLSEADFAELKIDAELVESDGHGEKVLRLPDGSYLKIFRRKRWFSKTLLVPPAQRFAANTIKLRQLGILCPEVVQLFRLKRPYRSVVHYRPLEGTTIRQLLNGDASIDHQELIAKLATFISTLHQRGVYFRSLHLGNIVLTPSGKLGLIDIADMRCIGKPLPTRLQKRNLQHLFRYADEWPAEQQAQLSRLLGLEHA